MAKTNNGANLGFEEKLWAAADKLRGHMDASEYKHVVLGLIFLEVHLRRLPGKVRRAGVQAGNRVHLEYLKNVDNSK